MVYLNDVEEGGETEFLYQQLKIKPSKGRVVIWPGSFTHLHRGNPPMSTKYIATGWFAFIGGMENRYFRLEESPHLEWHVTHSCNFMCDGCGHYTNDGYKQNITLETLREWYLPLEYEESVLGSYLCWEENHS